MKPLPLRLKITLWSMLVGGLGMIFFSIAAAISLHAIELGQIDRTLRLQSDDFFTSLNERGARMDWNDDVKVRELVGAARSLFAFEVEQPPGTVVYRSPSLGGSG